MRKFSLLIVLAALACEQGERRTAPPAEPPPPPASGKVEVGHTMPSYSAASLDGTSFDTAKERGNVLLLNLWATWCGPCRYEIPELQKLHDQYAKQGLKVVGVSVDEGAPAIVKEFVAEQKMTYPIVLDPEGRLAVLFDTSILPTSVIVDRRGRIVWKHLGIVSASDGVMMKALNAALQR